MEILTMLWAWITSIYAETIGKALMWIADFRKKWHEGTQAKHTAKRAKYEAEVTKINYPSMIQSAKSNQRADEIIPIVLAGIQEHRKTLKGSSPMSVERLQKQFPNDSREVLSFVIKKLSEQGELRFNEDLKDYYYHA